MGGEMRLSSTVPAHEQAEAYYRETYVLINNSKTANVIAMMKEVITAPLCEVFDGAEFVEVVSDFVKGRHVIVALGDSTTANYTSWPRCLASLIEGSESEAVIINLADWGATAATFVAHLAFWLDLLHSRTAGTVQVVYFGGLSDAMVRLRDYEMFLSGKRDTPMLEVEATLYDHPYCTPLLDLADEVPDDPSAANDWIIKRTLCIFSILDRVCEERGARFTAVLQPLSCPECSPSYRRALELVQQTTGDVGPFEEWCARNGYSLDPAPTYGVPGNKSSRVLLNKLRRAWQRARQRDGEKWVDLSALFAEESEVCFQSLWDAVHFDRKGTDLIARRMLEILGDEAGRMTCRQPGHRGREAQQLGQDAAAQSHGLNDAGGL